MAANMKAVKLRIKSVQSTMQITKAMELVASSKLRRAKDQADACRPYFRELYETLQEIAEGNTDFTSVYVKKPVQETWCYVMLAGDRGLAGGYNSNLFKALEAAAGDRSFVALPLGKKALEYCRRNGISVLTDQFAEIADISVADCFAMAKLLCREYRNKTIGHIELCYTRFLSMLSQQADVISLLPLSDLDRKSMEEKKRIRNLILYEPSAEEVFDAIVPEYLAGLLYGGVCEARASELAARRTAMESATSNAEAMIGQLNLYYNRARQASITQEITEIVGGAEGI